MGGYPTLLGLHRGLEGSERGRWARHDEVSGVSHRRGDGTGRRAAGERGGEVKAPVLIGQHVFESVVDAEAGADEDRLPQDRAWNEMAKHTNLNRTEGR